MTTPGVSRVHDHDVSTPDSQQSTTHVSHHESSDDSAHNLAMAASASSGSSAGAGSVGGSEQAGSAGKAGSAPLAPSSPPLATPEMQPGTQGQPGSQGQSGGQGQEGLGQKGLGLALDKQFHGRLKIDTHFCPEDVSDPFETVSWEIRSAKIQGEQGEVLFEQSNCEIPSTWSQLATNVVCSKYFYGEVGTDSRESSVRQMIHRVARTITDWGLADGYFASNEDGQRFYRDLAWICLHQYGAFNSPVWFNVGL